MAIETRTIIGTTEPPLAAAQRLSPRAGELAERIEQDRALPRELVDELLDAGLLSLCLPRALGGREARPTEMVCALEELARADAATAWCAMIASTSSLLGAYLPRGEAELVYAGGRSITGQLTGAQIRSTPRNASARGISGNSRS